MKSRSKMKSRGLESFQWMQSLCALVIAVVVRFLPPCVPSSFLSWYGSCRRRVCEFPDVVAVTVHVCAVLLVLWLRLLIHMLASSCHCSILSSMFVLVSSLMHALFWLCCGVCCWWPRMLSLAFPCHCSSRWCSCWFLHRDARWRACSCHYCCRWRS